jgi:hypothetical protein
MEDAGVVADAGADAEPTDGGAAAGWGADSGSSLDASDAGADASGSFGSTCPFGTVYTDPFTTNPLTSGRWTVITGPVTYDAADRLLQLATGNTNTQAWIGPRPAWGNYTVSVPVRIDVVGTGNGGINFRMSNPGTANNSGQMYYAGITTTFVQLGVQDDGFTQFAKQAASFDALTFHTLVVTANGSALSVAVDGTTYISDYTDTTFSAGSIGLRTFGSGMSYGAVTVTCNL